MGAAIMTPDPTQPDLQLLDINQVKQRVCLGTSTIYRFMDAGDFPQPMLIGTRAVRWLATDIDAWITARAAAPRRRKPRHQKAA
jgi:prophage regulatory protein